MIALHTTRREGRRYLRIEAPPDAAWRARAMVGMVAKAFGLEPYQVLTGAYNKRFGPARKISAIILKQLMGWGHMRVGDVFGLGADGARYLRTAGEHLMQIDPDVVRRHALAVEAIKTRWPAYRSRP